MNDKEDAGHDTQKTILCHMAFYPVRHFNLRML